MKRLLSILLSVMLLSGPALSADECLEAAVYEMNDLYSTGCGCEDGIFNAISSSMIGWGIGLFAGIALLAGLVHNAHVDQTTSSNNSSN